MDSVILQRILIRQARKQNPANPKEPLETILTGQWSDLKDGGIKVLSATTINGQSFTFDPGQGLSRVEIMDAAERALSSLETGTMPARATYACP